MNASDISAVIEVVAGIAGGAVIGFVVSNFFYHKSRQDIRTATENILGTILEVFPRRPSLPTEKLVWVGRKLTIETRFHVKVEAEVIAENVAVNVQMQTGEVVTAGHQLQVEMRYALINMDSPLLVMDSDKLVGIMWAKGLSPAGYSMGVVQLIEPS
jgi:hypothetical protein